MDLVVVEETTMLGLHFVNFPDGEYLSFIETPIVDSDKHYIKINSPSKGSKDIYTLYTRKFSDDMYFIERTFAHQKVEWMADRLDPTGLSEKRKAMINSHTRIPQRIKDKARLSETTFPGSP